VSSLACAFEQSHRAYEGDPAFAREIIDVDRR